MKLLKTIMKTAGILLTASMLLCSCQSTKASASTTVNGDSDYSDSVDEVAVVVNSDDNANDVPSEAEVYKSDATGEPDNASFMSRLLQGSVKFKEVGNFELSTVALNTKLKKQQATFMLDAKNYNAGFGSPIMAAYYVVLMDQKARSIFINAVDSYLSDFENKKLNRKDKKSYKRYGKSGVTIYWGVVKSQTSNYGYPDAFFGYTFKDKSPYFTITMYQTVNEKRKVDDSVADESMIVTYYFTKAQARTLADFLAEDNLYNFFGGNTPLVDETPAVDEY